MSERVVVVGAGSAGCVVAARLSEDPGTTVVLLEAGPDFPDVHAAPVDIRDAFVMGGTDHDWGYLSEPQAPPGAAATPGSEAAGVVPVLRGKVVGGSSAVNGTSIMRSSPTDFAAWVAAGNPAWGWDDVLAAYRRLEADPIGGPAHGTDGPLPVHRFPVAAMRPVHQAFLEAAASLGHPLIDDHNAPGSLGAGPIPLNQVDGVRMSAAVTHLLAAPRPPEPRAAGRRRGRPPGAGRRPPTRRGAHRRRAGRVRPDRAGGRRLRQPGRPPAQRRGPRGRAAGARDRARPRPAPRGSAPPRPPDVRGGGRGRPRRRSASWCRPSRRC